MLCEIKCKREIVTSQHTESSRVRSFRLVYTKLSFLMCAMVILCIVNAGFFFLLLLHYTNDVYDDVFLRYRASDSITVKFANKKNK